MSRLAVFSDIHSNLAALEACLKDMEEQGCEHFFCCGDIVGYGAHPNECCRIMIQLDVPCVMGNHDYMATTLDNIDSFNHIARKAILWTHRALKPVHLDYLKNLPYVRVQDNMTFVHASPLEPSNWHYILTRGEARVNFECFDTWMCFVGHSHQPFVVEQLLLESEQKDTEEGDTLAAFGDHKLLCPDPDVIELTDQKRYLINVGSVGQPRDRDPRACYTIVDTEKGRVAFRRIPYDIDSAQEAIIAAGLPSDLADRLSAGW
ncbi:MAG: metallophosphoesterase family protein [Candidatus Sumerlaeota bacterium]